MGKKIYLVNTKNYNNFIEAQKTFEEENNIVIVIDDIEIVDSETFRIENGNFTFDNKDLYYFDGIYYGYYNMVFANNDYTYYCLDGCWYE